MAKEMKETKPAVRPRAQIESWRFSDVERVFEDWFEDFWSKPFPRLWRPSIARLRAISLERNPWIIPEESSVEYAARLMRDHGIGLVPVGEKENITGVITDRDITIRVAAESKNAKYIPVREVMTPGGAYCFEDQDIEDACFMMEDKHVRRLLVFDRSLHLVGILSLDDVAARAREQQLAGYALAKVAKAA